MQACAPRWGHRVAVAVFALLALLVKAPQFVTPMGQDQGLYHAVAEEILRGGVPYRDAWDPKPPGVFYTHAAVLSLLSDPWRPCHIGPLPGLSRADLQPRCGALLFGTTDFVYSLVVAGLVLLVARRLGIGRSGEVLAFGLVAIFVNLALIDAEGSTPEKYALGPAVGVVLAGLAALQTRQRRWLVLAGVLGASAALFKIPDLASFGALSLVFVVAAPWARPALDVAATAGGPGLVVLAFVAMGAGAPFLEATVLYNFARVGFQSEQIPYAALASAWQLFRDGLALLWLAALAGVVAAWRVSRWSAAADLGRARRRRAVSRRDQIHPRVLRAARAEFRVARRRGPARALGGRGARWAGARVAAAEPRRDRATRRRRSRPASPCASGTSTSPTVGPPPAPSDWRR